MKLYSVLVICCVLFVFFVSCAVPYPQRIKRAYDDFALALFEEHNGKGFTVNGLVIIYSQGKKTIIHGHWNTGLEGSCWKDFEIFITPRNQEQIFDLTPHISTVETGQITRWKLEVSKISVSSLKHQRIIVKHKNAKIGSALIYG
ncbi:10035_t:CDS:1 [Paraglomus brasilianum]|uniref:10035_t:CDS:1 n=1 Tax=Paraglomus brasilianum TaxID=144538 RepID=A0A9N9GD34_9GLOM|nr:10035_t:CDS:1 [Paraglomus brasilianum]